MKKMTIKVTTVNDVYELNSLASQVNGEVTVYRGRYVIDAKSLMGLMSIDMSDGVSIEFPEDATEFETAISKYIQ